MKNASLAIAVALTLLALTLRFYGITNAQSIVGDEKYYTRPSSLAYKNFSQASISYNKGLARPPLGKTLINFGIWLIGDLPLGWRVMSAIFGSLTVFVLFYLTLMISRSRLGALLAALYLAVEPLHIALSRTGMLDSFLTFFSLLSVFLLYRYFSSRKKYWAVLSAISIGLAISCKWSAAYFVPALMILMLFNRQFSRSSERIGGLLWSYFSYIGIALISYLATWSPWLFSGLSFRELASIHVNMYRLQSFALNSQSNYAQKISSCGLMGFLFGTSPFSGFSWIDGSITFIRQVAFIANPLAWWLGLSASSVVLFLGFRRKNLGLMLPGIVVLFSLLPLAIQFRSYSIYYILPAMPFAFLAIGALLSVAPRNIRPAAFFISLIPLAVSAFLYPVAAAWPVKIAFIKPLLHWIYSRDPDTLRTLSLRGG